MRVSYIVAGYNEERIIKNCIEKCIEMLERDFEDYELILVDDASKDATGKIMQEYASRNPKIVFIENQVNLNFGTAVLRGMKSARYETVAYNAADLPVPLEDTRKLVEEAQKYDVLVLERESYAATSWRKITSRGNLLLLNILFPLLMRGTPVVNYAQIWKRNRLESVMPLARSPIFVWPEMVFRAKLKGYRVGNIKNKPHIDEKRAGAFGKPHDIIWGIYEMLRFRIRLWQKNI